MATTIHDILEELRASATSEHDKGEEFERLIQAYLKTDLVYANQYSDVWMWGEYPDRHHKPDTGIDLVAKDRETGELTAIQCKFYAAHHYLQKSDIDSFFTASGKQGFSTADCLHDRQVVQARRGCPRRTTDRDAAARRAHAR